MCLTCIPAGAMAAGSAKDKVKTAKVTFSANSNKTYDMVSEELTVKSNLAEEYFPDSVGYEAKDAVTVADVLVAAHIKKYGKKFENEPDKYMKLTESDKGMYAVTLFKQSTGSQIFKNNDGIMSISTATVVNGDYVHNVITSATDSSWASKYTYFDKAKYKTTAGKTLKTKVLAVGYGENGNPVEEAAKDFTIRTVNKKSLKTAAQKADIKGNTAGIKFTKAGEFYLTAAEKVKDTMFAPIAKVTVDPAKVTIKSAKAGSKKVTLKWKKTAGAKQYQVYRAEKKNGKFKKVATVKKTSFTNKKLKKGKKYFFKVRGIAKVDGKTYKGAFSKVKSVKAK